MSEKSCHYCGIDCHHVCLDCWDKMIRRGAKAERERDNAQAEALTKADAIERGGTLLGALLGASSGSLGASIARVMARVDVELWDSQRLLPQIIAVRSRPGALSCEWTDREIAAVAGDLREYLTQADLDDVIARAYPDALRAELERLAR